MELCMVDIRSSYALVERLLSGKPEMSDDQMLALLDEARAYDAKVGIYVKYKFIVSSERSFNRNCCKRVYATSYGARRGENTKRRNIGLFLVKGFDKQCSLSRSQPARFLPQETLIYFLVAQKLLSGLRHHRNHKGSYLNYLTLDVLLSRLQFAVWRRLFGKE